VLPNFCSAAKSLPVTWRSVLEKKQFDVFKRPFTINDMLELQAYENIILEDF